MEDQRLNIDGLLDSSTRKNNTNINPPVSQNSSMKKGKTKVKGNGATSVLEDKLDGENIGSKKGKSEVWNNFNKVGIVDGVDKCQC